LCSCASHLPFFFSFSSSLCRRPPIPTLFSYTTLFRSNERSPPLTSAPRSSTWYRPSLAAGGTANSLEADSPPVPVLRHCSGWVKDRKSTRLNSSHVKISYAVFCLKKKKTSHEHTKEQI